MTTMSPTVPTGMFDTVPSPQDQNLFTMSSQQWAGNPSALWNSNVDYLDSGVTPANDLDLTPPSDIDNTDLSQGQGPIKQDLSAPARQLFIDPTTRKSRVETQIPIKLTLTSLPKGVKHLHLPTHTIAKPKLLAKEVQKSADTLELDVMLVCASAMKNDSAKRRAFRLAAGLEEKIKKENPDSNPSSPQHSGPEDDPDKPLNGGEVRICKNCINREAKRAARKKVKSPEDESQWRQYEHDRVVVFNTQEYKEWKPWEPSKSENAIDSPDLEKTMPEEAMMVEVPMRIACYCRHQGEKDGFQIIFTIKDAEDRLLAQNISESIVITDDHKTAPGATLPDASSYAHLPQANFMATEQGGQLPRAYQSAPDLYGMLQQPQMTPFLPQSQLYHSSRLPSRPTSATETPKNSRPPSPDNFSSGPNKKRKSSGPGNRFPGLVMTPITVNTSQQPPPTSMPNSAGLINTVTTGQTPAFSPQNYNFPFTIGLNDSFHNQREPPHPHHNQPAAPRLHRRNGNSNNNFTFYSAPGSELPSRSNSPISHRPPNLTYQSNLARGVAAGFGQTANIDGVGNGVTSPTEPTGFSAPSIESVTPAEGPMSGNITIALLGTQFINGIEVVFGDQKALATQWWNDGSLSCILPPAVGPGPVPVTFLSIHGQPLVLAGQPTYFVYYDDRLDKFARELARLGVSQETIMDRLNKS